MEADAVIGQLYRELADFKQANTHLVALVAGIKSGDIPLDRIEVTPEGIVLKPALVAVEQTA